jgi:hypothetical protein
MRWLERWQQRQYEIAQGADANLIRENVKRFRWSGGLFVAGGLLAWVAGRFQLAHALHVAAYCLAVLLLIASWVLFSWARAQDGLLRRPDPEGPPSILKK